MQTTGGILNPLGLTVWTERPYDLAPYDTTTRPGDVAEITASMKANGWQGLPLVIDDRGLESGGQLLTGSQRRTAACGAGIDVPLVSVTEVAAVAGMDIDAYDNGEGWIDWERFFGALPAEILAATGFDL